MTDITSPTKAFEVTNDENITTITFPNPSVIAESTDESFPTANFMNLFSLDADPTSVDYRVLKAHEESYFALIELISTLEKNDKGFVIDLETGSILKKGVSTSLIPYDYEKELDEKGIIIASISTLLTANNRIYNNINVDFGPNIVTPLEKVDTSKDLLFINEGVNILNNLEIRNKLFTALVRSTFSASNINLNIENSDINPYFKVAEQLLAYYELESKFGKKES